PRALLRADCIVVGIDRPRPIAGSHEVACASGLVRREAPMVAERFQIAQSLRVRTGGALERAAGPLVQIGPTREQEILIDGLMHERMREPVVTAVMSDLLNEVGLGEARERGLGGFAANRNG